MIIVDLQQRLPGEGIGQQGDDQGNGNQLRATGSGIGQQGGGNGNQLRVDIGSGIGQQSGGQGEGSQLEGDTDGSG